METANETLEAINTSEGTSTVVNQMITDDIEALFDVLPPRIRERLRAMPDGDQLIEIVMDLGRLPEARFPNREVVLSDHEITHDDLEYVVSRIGEFGGDNRAGIERTLHRISAIRNRRGDIVGLTCRVGRAVFGTIDIIRDIVESGKSILLLGRPGVGKTTMLRETARVLAEKKRVVIVDTSNEIGGDGDIPHPAIGRARRMQVPRPELQHEVMIEAVENHMPEVIVIDEIGRELEALAARTIAERGVQLVGTAHGNTLDNLLMNPTLSDLLGGIQSVTLSDEEARRRGTQKSVLERKAPPTFDIVIEIQDRDTLVIHHDVARAVDAMLRGYPVNSEVRRRDESRPSGYVSEEVAVEPGEMLRRAGGLRGRPTLNERTPTRGRSNNGGQSLAESPSAIQPTAPVRSTMRVYPYGISQNRLKQAAKALNLPLLIVTDLGEADMLMTLRSYYRKRPQIISDAERRGLPVYVLRSNTVAQMEQALADIFGLAAEVDPYTRAMEEARLAIEKIQSGQATSVELSPQSAYIRRQQHELARQANLISRSLGKEPRRRVRIYANKTL
ncbi:R3H domain-containing nucleic acid-binding protein [Ardenticatena maritima]|nr:R3H domain-containing nucleic acid-binding protein [Ardenticatena maritima]